MSIRKLASQTATYGMVTIIVRFINYFMTPYFTYLSIFTESVYGVMGYYYSLIPLGLTLLTMGLETGYFKFVGKATDDTERRKLFNTLTTAIAATSTLFFALTLLFTDQIYSLFDGDKAGLQILIPIVAAIIAVDAVISMPFAKLRYEGNTTKFMKIKVANVLINLVLSVFFYSVLPLLSEKGILTQLWNPDFGCGYVFVANLIASLASLIMLRGEMKGFSFKIDKKMLRTVFIFSLPLFIGGISGTANEFIDRQLLFFLLPDATATSQIGVYTAAMKIASFIYLFTQMYKYAAEPFFLSEVKGDDFKKKNADALKYFTIASLAIFLFITLYMDYFQYFIGERFRSGIKIVPLLLLSNLLAGVLLNLSYWYKVSEKTHFAIIITVSGLVTTTVINLLLIPRLGYVGAAWSRVACEVVMVILSYILGQRYMKINYDLKGIAKYTVIAIILYISYNMIDIESNILKFIISSLFFTIFVLYFMIEQKLIKRIINKIKR